MDPGSPFGLPISVLTDSYKAAHFEQYPEALECVAYGEFRAPYKEGQGEGRFLFYGIRHIVERYLLRQWTEQDVENSAKFYATHNAGFKPFPYPRDLFLKFVRENNGYFPVRLQALPEATAAHIHVPVYQITATGEYSRLVTFLETILTHVWYTTTVATLSRRTKDLIDKAYETSVDAEAHWSKSSRLHDFGFRGCTCVEQATLGGAAHLLSFEGSDNMAAAYYVQFHLNGGKPVATSIPATEHSVMTSWKTENEAILNMIDKYGDGVFACVMDSYDYVGALTKVLPDIAAKKKAKGGYMVLRPDSGDPCEAVMLGLTHAEATFGATKNKKGYKVLDKVGVIQGDGINFAVLDKILKAVLAAGYSAENCAFGMGGGLLQRCDRDTMSFATKLSYIHYAASGQKRDIMKKPLTDTGKISLPGVLQVKRVDGIPTVFPRDPGAPVDADDLLQTVYDNGPVAGFKWDDFDTLRARAAAEWVALPKVHDPISAPLKAKIAAWKHEFKS